MNHRIASGPLRDGISVSLPELADELRMSKRQTREALAGLIERGFIVNLTPELSLDRAVFRLTMFPYQGAAPTNDYVERGQ
jgi:DNA-binding IclR family transcriptional regulator